MGVRKGNNTSQEELLLENQKLRAQNQELSERLAEAEETLRAIRSGEVDALIVAGERGEQVYTLKGAELPYRTLIEEMREGATTLTIDNTMIYCNHGFAQMLKTSLEKMIGAKIEHYVSPVDKAALEKLLLQARTKSSRGEITFLAGDGTPVPTYLSINTMKMDGVSAIYIIAVDLTGDHQLKDLSPLC